VTNINIFLIHADHLPGLLGPSDDGREAAFGGIISGHSYLYEAGATVNN
jgi:hypothetical protein